MDEKEKIEETEGISLSDIFGIFKKFWVGLVSLTAIGALIGVLCAFVFIPKKYQISDSITCPIVSGDSSSTSTIDSNAINTTYTFVNAAKDRVSDRTIYKNVTEKIKTEKEIDYDYKDLMKDLVVSSNNSLTITFTFTSRDKTNMPYIINTFTSEAISYLEDQIHVTFVAGDEAQEDDIYDESTSKIIVIGGATAVGLVVGICYAFIKNSLDKTIKDKKFIEDTYGIKVIGTIPDLADKSVK